MEKVITRNALRFIFLLLLQGLIFYRVNIGGPSFNYIQIFVYPLFILLLPVKISTSLLMTLAFLLGISLDFFYDSPGLHASASVFSAFIRPLVLSSIEPRGGYKVNAVPVPSQLGTNWMFRYMSIILFLHLLWYFSLEAFQISKILSIILKTIFTFMASLLFMGLYMLIFNPKE